MEGTPRCLALGCICADRTVHRPGARKRSIFAPRQRGSHTPGSGMCGRSLRGWTTSWCTAWRFDPMTVNSNSATWLTLERSLKSSSKTLSTAWPCPSTKGPRASRPSGISNAMIFAPSVQCDSTAHGPDWGQGGGKPFAESATDQHSVPYPGSSPPTRRTCGQASGMDSNIP